MHSVKVHERLQTTSNWDKVGAAVKSTDVVFPIVHLSTEYIVLIHTLLLLECKVCAYKEHQVFTKNYKVYTLHSFDSK